ncbi:604_t:CDS:2, partial [Paraglomus brasilianum]
MPIFMLQVANTTIKFAELDSFLGVVLKDFPLLNFDIPLEPCGSDGIWDFVKNALTIRGYVYDAAAKLSDVWDDLEEPCKQAKNS